MNEKRRTDAASMLEEFNTPTALPPRETATTPSHKGSSGKSSAGSWWGSLRAVFALPDASSHERLVLLALLSRSRGARTAIVGIDELSRLCGCSERTVRRALRSAVDRGLVAIQSRGNRVKGPTLYRLNLFNRSESPVETRSNSGHRVRSNPSQQVRESTLQEVTESTPLKRVIGGESAGAAPPAKDPETVSL